jgi:signal transduction histidine kinase
VKHNIPTAGFIKVQVSSANLTIANSGPPLTTDPRKLLERFQKQNTSTASLGLGLAIINKICQMNHLDLSYTYENDVHTISISKQDIEI